MHNFLTALQFLTRIRLPANLVRPSAPLAQANRWFPAVGLVLGALVGSSAYLGTLWNPWLGALFAVLAWTLITGGLHLDGLADLADALGAAHQSQEKLINVLSDPHIGGFGVIALILQLLSKFVLILLLLQKSIILPLLLIPAWSRLGASWWSSSIPPIKSGLASQLTDSLSHRTLLLWTALLISSSMMFAPALVLAPILALLWRSYLLKKLGGMNGDSIGAGIEVLESLLLLLFILFTFN